jgi:uncharacterized protein (TIGR00255 family)
MGGSQIRIKSMTGFGRGAAAREGVRVEVELKGVNHRFLDLKMRLPADLEAHEPELRDRVQRMVTRARLDVVFSLVTSRPPAYRLEINRRLVSEYLEAAAALKKEFRLRGSIPLEAVVVLPGAVTIRGEAAAADGVAAKLTTDALDQALAAYDAMRTQEGTRLVSDLRGRLEAIDTAASQIQGAARELPEIYARRLRQRVEGLLKEPGLDEVRLAQQVALLADRVDITEELVRLQGYVQQARVTLERPEGPVGKTLDFMMQEMSREANTISSKAEALPICQAALRIKCEVEKIREQVQNLE